MDQQSHGTDNGNWQKYLIPINGSYIAGSRPELSNLVELLTGQQLKFNHRSLETIRQLLYERQHIRDKNHGGIMDQITDVSGEISCCGNFRYNQEAKKRELSLAKLKDNLERELRDQDITLWRDTFELRRELIDAEKRYQSSKLRTGLVSKLDHDENKSISDAAYSRYVSGS